MDRKRRETLWRWARELGAKLLAALEERRAERAARALRMPTSQELRARHDAQRAAQKIGDVK